MKLSLLVADVVAALKNDNNNVPCNFADTVVHNSDSSLVVNHVIVTVTPTPTSRVTCSSAKTLQTSIVTLSILLLKPLPAILQWLKTAKLMGYLRFHYLVIIQ